MYLEMDYNKLSEIFVNNLLETNRGFDFYVNWENAKAYKEFEIELNAMNVLIRADNIKEKFHTLLLFLSITLQNRIAAPVLTDVASIPAPTIAAGFTLPYWLR